jgi:hypothetical protein
MSTPHKPPSRLVDDPSTSSLVRSDLENVTGAAPGYDAASGLLALQAALGTGASAAAAAPAGTTHGVGASAAQAVKSALGLKLAIAGGVGAIVIAGAAVIIQPAPKSTAPAEGPRPAKAIEQPAPVIESAKVIGPAPVTVTAPAPVLSPQASVVPRDRAAAEIAQLAQIKAAVERAPARALRLAEQGHRRFGEGYLHHEREGLAIVALHGLGREREAHARAQRFLARYPHSSLSDRVRALQLGAGDR